jgi:glycosyltransferase involved in cell wall biosynthesis
MRIGAVLTGYAPESGGGFTFEDDILQAVISLHDCTPHHITLIVPQAGASALSDYVGTKIPVASLPAGNRLQRTAESLVRESMFFRRHLRVSSRLDRLAGKERLDVLFFLSAGVHVTQYPYVTIVWDLQHRTMPWFPELNHSVWESRELAWPWFIQKASLVITGTQVGSEEIGRFYGVPKDRIVILPHPTPRFALAAGPSDNGQVLRRLGVTPPYLLYPAQFWPHKNHVSLLLAVKRLRDNYGLAPQLVLVGSDKGNHARVNKLCRELGLIPQVLFLGFVDRADLVALYRGAMALAYTSFGGPENLPPLEAFALGCPVIAARVPGADEQLDNCAILVSPSDPEDIAGAIYRVLNGEGLRAELIAKGRERAVRWTAEDFVRGALAGINTLSSYVRCWSEGSAS